MTERKRATPTRYVHKEDCDTIHRKIDLALLGPDGTGLNGGIVRDISDIKAFIKGQCEKNSDKKAEHTEEHKEYRSFIFAIIGGAIVTVINIAILLLLHI
jgi:hypothetical protein